MADPALRGAGRPAEAGRRGPRADPPERRPGGGRGRGLRTAPRRRRRLLRPPRPRPRARQGRPARPSDGRADGPRGRALPRPRRLDAPGRRRARPDGATGVVGGNIPIALGSALPADSDGGDQATVVFFGDGAVQAGHFNETVNLATLWGLPLILVCENNGFAEFTPRSAHTNVERVSDVVAPYELDPRDGRRQRRRGGAGRVRRASSRGVRKGGGPLLLECLTHRLRGHYEGDPAQYREALADEEWQAEGSDPAASSGPRPRRGWFDEERRRPPSSRGAGGGRSRGRVRPGEAPSPARDRRRSRLRRLRAALMAETTFEAVNARSPRRCAPTTTSS